MEGVLVLATILRDLRLRLVPGSPDPLLMTPSVNLRPKEGVPLVLERRLGGDRVQRSRQLRESDRFDRQGRICIVDSENNRILRAPYSP